MMQYIQETQQNLKKFMDGNFSDVPKLLKTSQKGNLFVDHCKQHFKSTASQCGLCVHMILKEFKQINTIR